MARDTPLMPLEDCEHQQAYPEGVEWPLAVAADHLSNCFTETEQREKLAALIVSARRGVSCFEQDHPGRVHSQALYTQRLLTGIRELIEHLESIGEPRELDIRNRLRDLIS
jgi:hypothetical protein